MDATARALARRLRGPDFHRAVQAIAALRLLDPQAAASLVPVEDTADEQRAFQLTVARVVAGAGVAGLAARWHDLASSHWREMLVTEIGQTFAEWIDEATVELLVVALQDPHDSVARRAVSPLTSCLREVPPRERRELARSKRGQAYLEALERAAPGVTPARRARIAGALASALERCSARPMELFWPDSYVELLGLAASRSDARSLRVLEGLRTVAGETRRSEVERIDPDNLPWESALLAARKGVTPVARVWSRATGLLDAKGLERAITRIRARAN